MEDKITGKKIQYHQVMVVNLTEFARRKALIESKEIDRRERLRLMRLPPPTFYLTEGVYTFVAESGTLIVQAGPFVEAYPHSKWGVHKDSLVHLRNGYK
jgi:hypothetical protein